MSPLLGVVYHWIGGFAAASFYIPYRKVRQWSWETYWLVGGFFSWIIMPWLMAYLLVPHLREILHSASGHTLFWAYFFGAMWGIGGLTFGLTMRYLGIALGMAVALGYTAVFGTLIPPLVQGGLAAIASSGSGRYILLGVLMSVLGIIVSGLAGMSKERELSSEQKQKTVKEFHFGKGMLIATFSGIMSSCMAFALAAGTPITNEAKTVLLANGASDIWQGLPVLIVVLLGGFTTNFLWCASLNIRNRSGGEYFGRTAASVGALQDGSVMEVAALEAVEPWDENSLRQRVDRTATLSQTQPRISPRTSSKSLVPNYLFSAIAGITWYLQFFFYTMGQAKMGTRFAFSNWTLHMASIMIFSMLLGIALKEWAGTGRRTHLYIGLGLLLLVGSTVIIGYGNYVGAMH